MEFQKKKGTDARLLEKIDHLIHVGISLSVERDSQVLLEKILTSAKQLTHADGGTIYSLTPDRKLRFEILWTDSLNFRLGGLFGEKIPFAELPLYLEDGTPNDKLIVAYAVNKAKTINIKDAYSEKGFDFSGTRAFDLRTGYRTKAVLTIPIKNHENTTIAVLQLINPIDEHTKNVGFFSEEDQEFAEALASQAGVALANQSLISNLNELFESFIRVIAQAIDEKSPSTGNHGRRVPIVAQLLAESVGLCGEGPLKDISFTEDELYELKVAAFLHDCGKITTPVHIVEKSRKLETIFDRIDLIDTRFEVTRRDAYIQLLEDKLLWYENRVPHLKHEMIRSLSDQEIEYEKKVGSFNRDQQFLHRCNKGEEAITDASKQRIKAIGIRTWKKREQLTPFLSADEIENLTVSKGNLTDKERSIIENHVVMTQRMLTQLPYPKNLRQVPEIAGSHHEWVNGKGYPKGLTKEHMSIRARILAIADIFEALSSPDRPYKKAHPLSEVIRMMEGMVKEGHIDGDLFEVFLKEKVPLKYAREHLTPEQIDWE
jgi:HD-GYP domain-containing protein (c-di-GMP phosphodiesterase class II)/DNA-dependent RNA polymerase auxiliary subunit epsilon